MTTTVSPESSYIAPEATRGAWTTSFDPEFFGVPTGREEAWRFTPVRALKAALKGDESGTALTAQHSVPAGASVVELAHDDPSRSVVPQPADRPAALAYSRCASTLLVTIDKEAELDAPVVLKLSGEGQTAYGHIVVQAEAHSKAHVVLEYSGSATYSELVSVSVADGAQLTMASAQLWSEGATHLTQHDVVVGRDAVARHVALTIGGSVVRMSANAHYDGPGGTAELYGAYLAGPGQHIEHRSFADHSVEKCVSDVLYKGALHGDDARTVWVGDVLIRKQATGTNTYELNKNLLLTDGARADSIPNLEIETGEIEGAGHASTSGKFDELHMFYLQSRGIPAEVARKLVVRGFFADIVARVGQPDITEEWMTRIDEELDATL